MTAMIDHIRAKTYYYLADLTVGKLALCFGLLWLVSLLLRCGGGKEKKPRLFLGDFALCACLTAILSVTLLGRQGTASPDGSVFAFFKKLLDGTWIDYYDIFFNALLFLPLGLLLGLRCAWGRACLLTLLCSLAVETLQLLSGRGMFEASDLLFNTVGGALGAGLALGLRGLRKTKQAKTSGRTPAAPQENDDD